MSKSRILLLRPCYAEHAGTLREAHSACLFRCWGFKPSSFRRAALARILWRTSLFQRGRVLPEDTTMQGYRRGSHTVYDIKYHLVCTTLYLYVPPCTCMYHLVWVTKYRYHVLVPCARGRGSPAGSRTHPANVFELGGSDCERACKPRPCAHAGIPAVGVMSADAESGGGDGSRSSFLRSTS